MSDRRVSVFGTAVSTPGDPDYEEARRLGRLLAEAGYTVCTGGYMGAMGAVSQGAHEVGGHVVGVTITAWADERAPNPWLKEEIATRSLHERLEHLVGSAALLAVHGGVGTLVEVALGWNLLQRDALPARPPLILIGERWRRAVAALADTLAIGPADLALLTFVETPEEALAALRSQILRTTDRVPRAE